MAVLYNSFDGQVELALPDQNVELRDDAVPVTDKCYALQLIAQLHRDRADAENGVDELKNRWEYRIYHPGHRTLADQRPSRGAGLQRAASKALLWCVAIISISAYGPDLSGASFGIASL